ncbi:MAG: hypothetical protein KDD46_05425 [Bdellovibrionales bacterium]|nr:hypothetical protein [Bdellovibrionales bacterium]
MNIGKSESISTISEKLANQVVSKKRVADHGEVYTNPREVNAMLDLVKSETQRIDSRFLEPACGTGNFLVEILSRKLEVVYQKYSSNQSDFERYLILAVSSIYGIELLQDNVLACRKRLIELVTSTLQKKFKNKTHQDVFKSVEFILEKNIIWGDALTLKTVGKDPKPIVFSEWSLVHEGMIKRRDFAFDALLNHAQMRELPLFSDLGDEVFIPSPVKDYPLVSYLQVYGAS